MFSMPALAKPFLNCSSFGNFKVSFLLELDLAKSTEPFSRVWCEMASFKLKNKSEKCFSPESHGRSAPAAAAGCSAPLPLSGCPCLCAVIWAGARPRPHRLTLKGSPVQTHRLASPGFAASLSQVPCEGSQSGTALRGRLPPLARPLSPPASFSALVLSPLLRNS